jgi:hypothetical protein
MLKAKRMRLEFTPVNAPPVVADFQLEGFAKPFEELSKTCDWTESR